MNQAEMLEQKNLDAQKNKPNSVTYPSDDSAHANFEAQWFSLLLLPGRCEETNANGSHHYLI